MTPAEARDQLAVLTAMTSSDNDLTVINDDCDGPTHQMIVDADENWFSDRAERLDQRAFWGGAE